MAELSRIEQLIHNLCPNGVEYTTLGALGTFESAGVDKKIVPGEQDVTLLNYVDVFNHQYIDASIPSMRVTASDKKIVQCNVLKNDIFITPSSETIDEIGRAAVIMEDLKNTVYSYHIMRYRLYSPNTTTAKYIRYLFDTSIIQQQIAQYAQGLTRFGVSKSNFAAFNIPFPPFAVQEEVVRIFDTFCNLVDNIGNEIQERKRQFDAALNSYFDADIKKVKIADLGTITRGRRFVRTDIMEQGTPCIHYGDIYMRYPICVHEALTFLQGEITKKMRYAKNGDVVYVGAGENDEDIGMAIAWLGKEPAAVHDACYILSNHNQDAKYLAYMSHANNFHQQLKKSVATGKICSIPPDGLGRVIIPLPSLKEQQAIAAKLDTIEAFIANLNEERTLRQQQYEYYRAKLISLLK